jgi:hypothetical protein
MEGGGGAGAAEDAWENGEVGSGGTCEVGGDEEFDAGRGDLAEVGLEVEELFWREESGDGVADGGFEGEGDGGGGVRGVAEVEEEA